MTILFFADLVRETSRTSGTDNMQLDGPVAGYRSFANSVPAGRTFYYAISHDDEANEWEVGIGHLDAQSLLARAPIISSHNDELVDFSSGRKNINLTISADWFNQQSNEVIAHQHDMASIDGLDQALASKQEAGDYASANHSHDAETIAGLSDILTSKQEAGDYASADHSHDAESIAGLSDILASKQEAGDYASADHSHDAETIAGLSDILASKQEAGDYADANHEHSFADLGINNLTAQNFLRTNDRLNVAVGASGQNFVTIAGDAFPARRADGGNIISPSTIEIPSGTIQLAYAASRPDSGPSLRWGANYTNMLGFYINAGLNYQGDQNNGSFNVRTQTNNGFLGGLSVVLHPQEASKFRHGIEPMLDNRSDIGAANKRISNLYLANNPIVTSDERHKENIALITDQMLDWYGAIIQWKNFTMKGEGGKDSDGKIQIGVLAQDIERGAKSVGMDDDQIAAMGLLNYHKWDAQYEDALKLDDDGHQMLDDDGEPIMERNLIQEAGDSYGVKYDQLFALASAWSLRETKRQQGEINALKEQINTLIERI